MNKNCYRIIFSQARGMFVAVAEIVKSRSKTAGGRGRADRGEWSSNVTGQSILLGTDDFREGLSAAREKRAATFSGR